MVEVFATRPCSIDILTPPHKIKSNFCGHDKKKKSVDQSFVLCCNNGLSQITNTLKYKACKLRFRLSTDLSVYRGSIIHFT